MIQSMEILQLSTLELDNYLEKLAMENPVIQLEEKSGEEDQKSIDAQRKLDWLASTDQQNRVYYSTDMDMDDMENNWHDINEEGEDLREYLHAQLLSNKYSAREQEILQYLVESLNENGYFTEDINDTADYLNTDAETVTRMLEIIQSLDPAGIGARNLSECLLIQLRRGDTESELAEEIVTNYLNELAKQHMKIIASRLSVSTEEVRRACELIRSLNPKPANAFSDRRRLNYVTPDVVVVKLDGEFQILINDYQYPKFSIDKYYANLVKTTTDTATKKYLQEKIQQARNVQESIQTRSSTLMKVMKEIVERQLDFFVRGPGYKKPMRLADIAETVKLHESTISRTMSSKYLQCSWGVFPLNYFLTSVAVHDAAGGGDKTKDQVKARIQEIIDKENKNKPYSDDAISKELARQDIKISRRTVNKYRTEMGIPDKSGRGSANE